MATFIFTKQSSEEFPISVDFTNLLITAETISILEVIAYDESSIDVTSTVISNSSIDGVLCKVIVKNGVNKEKYKITIKITTSNSYKYEADVYMQIYDI